MKSSDTVETIFHHKILYTTDKKSHKNITIFTVGCVTRIFRIPCVVIWARENNRERKKSLVERFLRF